MIQERTVVWVSSERNAAPEIDTEERHHGKERNCLSLQGIRQSVNNTKYACTSKKKPVFPYTLCDRVFYQKSPEAHHETKCQKSRNPSTPITSRILFANPPPPAYCQKIYLSPKISAQNIHLHRNKFSPILKRIARMFARCCEQKIVVKSESMSQLRLTHV